MKRAVGETEKRKIIKNFFESYENSDQNKTVEITYKVALQHYKITQLKLR